MCEHCDEETDTIRPIVDAIIVVERQQRKVFSRNTQGQHAVRLANVILESHQDDDGCMDSADVKAIALEYALAVQRLIALQEVSGLA